MPLLCSITHEDVGVPWTNEVDMCIVPGFRAGTVVGKVVADGRSHARNTGVEQYLVVPLDEFGANIGGDEDLEGPFAMVEGVIKYQGDALGLAVLYVVAVVRECLDAGQVGAGLLVFADTAEINRRHGSGLEQVELLFVFRRFW